MTTSNTDPPGVAYRHPLPSSGEACLHPSHKWGQRPVYERTAAGSNLFHKQMIPCCLNCLVDGYEDVWDAFQPCRRVKP